MKEKPPYVCNNCRRSASCLFETYLYNADYAHREYEETLIRSREGINLTRDELIELDALISPMEGFEEETVKKLGLTKMNPDEVHLMPDLIK